MGRLVSGSLGVAAGQAVTNDLDVYCSANLIVQQHGDEAPAYAAARADELFAVGDLAGAVA